jgi:hypothetical protein
LLPLLLLLLLANYCLVHQKFYAISITTKLTISPFVTNI